MGALRSHRHVRLKLFNRCAFIGTTSMMMCYWSTFMRSRRGPHHNRDSKLTTTWTRLSSSIRHFKFVDASRTKWSTAWKNWRHDTRLLRCSSISQVGFMTLLKWRLRQITLLGMMQSQATVTTRNSVIASYGGSQYATLCGRAILQLAVPSFIQPMACRRLPARSRHRLDTRTVPTSRLVIVERELEVHLLSLRISMQCTNINCGDMSPVNSTHTIIKPGS